MSYIVEKVNNKGKIVKVKMAGKNPNPEVRPTWEGCRPTVFAAKHGKDRYAAQHNGRQERNEGY